MTLTERRKRNVALTRPEPAGLEARVARLEEQLAEVQAALERYGASRWSHS